MLPFAECLYYVTLQQMQTERYKIRVGEKKIWDIFSNFIFHGQKLQWVKNRLNDKNGRKNKNVKRNGCELLC